MALLHPGGTFCQGVHRRVLSGVTMVTPEYLLSLSGLGTLWNTSIQGTSTPDGRTVRLGICPPTSSGRAWTIWVHPSEGGVQVEKNLFPLPNVSFLFSLPQYVALLAPRVPSCTSTLAHSGAKTFNSTFFWLDDEHEYNNNDDVS